MNFLRSIKISPIADKLFKLSGSLVNHRGVHFRVADPLKMQKSLAKIDPREINSQNVVVELKHQRLGYWIHDSKYLKYLKGLIPLKISAQKIQEEYQKVNQQIDLYALREINLGPPISGVKPKKIGIVQLELGSPFFKLAIQNLAGKVDFIVLPEYFSVNPNKVPANLEEAWNNSKVALRGLKKLSREHQVTIIGGSVIEKDKNGSFYNTSFIFKNGRTIGKYRKVHLTDGEKSWGLKAGKEYKTFNLNGTKIAVLLCADVLSSKPFQYLKWKRPEIVFVPLVSPSRTEKATAKLERDQKLFFKRAKKLSAYIVKVGGVGKVFEQEIKGRSLVASPEGILWKAEDENNPTVISARIDLGRLNTILKWLSDNGFTPYDEKTDTRSELDKFLLRRFDLVWEVAAAGGKKFIAPDADQHLQKHKEVILAQVKENPLLKGTMYRILNLPFLTLPDKGKTLELLYFADAVLRETGTPIFGPILEALARVIDSETEFRIMLDYLWEALKRDRKVFTDDPPWINILRTAEEVSKLAGPLPRGAAEARLSEIANRHFGLKGNTILGLMAKNVDKESLFKYLNLVLADPLNARHLIDHLRDNTCFGTTSFFRYPEQLIWLKDTLPELLTNVLEGKVKELEEKVRLRQSRGLVGRITPDERNIWLAWSAAAANGMEPYMVAILIHETLKKTDPTLQAKIKEWDITLRILATDVWGKDDIIYKAAREGIYAPTKLTLANNPETESLVRGLIEENVFGDAARDAFIKKFFMPTADGKWQLSPEILEMVKFEYFNLKSPSLPPQKFKLIFVRNVLYYLEDAEKIVTHLKESVDENGYLFLDPNYLSLGNYPFWKRRGIYSPKIIEKRSEEDLIETAQDIVHNLVVATVAMHELEKYPEEEKIVRQLVTQHLLSLKQGDVIVRQVLTDLRDYFLKEADSQTADKIFKKIKELFPSLTSRRRITDES